MHEMVKEELGDHHQLILCPAHKLELTWHDAFKTVQLNTECENDSANLHYYFKCANLKWQLFKRQPIFMGQKFFRYKWPTGTCWVEHQKLNSKAKLQGLLTDNSDFKKIVFNTIKIRHFICFVPCKQNFTGK